MSGLPDLSQLRRLPPDLRAEILRRMGRRDRAVEASGFLAELHPHQKKFIADKSRRKALLCSRRAGKSYVILAWLIQGALTDPGGLSAYIASSKGVARRNLQPAIDHYSARWPQLELKASEQDGQLMLSVGCVDHTIWLAGAKDSSAIEKFRGAKYKRVAIDEAQACGPYLLDLVRDVFEPALLDKRGDLVLAGTPSPIPAGLFYEATTGEGSAPGWSTHHWTLFDNPHITDAADEVRRFREQYGLNEDSATYRREYLGKWVLDEGALVYPYTASKNKLPEDESVPERASYVLGVDIGFTDATAFVVVAISPLSPSIYVVEAHKETGLAPFAVAREVEKLIAKYGRGLRIVVDEGGAGKGYAEEMRQRYGIGCEPAEKTKKRAYQEIVAGELRSGTIKVVARQCEQLLAELAVLQWGPDKKEDDRFENHCADALLYAVRASHTWYREPPPAGPAPGTDEWHREEARRTRAKVIEQVRKRNRRKGFSDYRR